MENRNVSAEKKRTTNGISTALCPNFIFIVEIHKETGWNESKDISHLFHN